MSDVASRQYDLDTIPVEFLAWPQDATRRAALARAGMPRILLVAHDSEAPTDIGIDEDWIRLPAAESDVLARAKQLLRFGESLGADAPFIDASRVLHRAGATVVLSATDAAIMVLLLRHVGAVVDHESLEREIWHGSAPSRDALDAAMYRLRRRLAGLSMSITSVRGRGFALTL